MEEEEQEDHNDNILPDFDDLVQNLLTSEERARRVLEFKRVLDELKQSISSGSTFSRFSFLVRLLYIKSHYWVSNNYFDALLALLLDAFPRSNVPNHLRRHTVGVLTPIPLWLSLGRPGSKGPVHPKDNAWPSQPGWSPAQGVKADLVIKQDPSRLE